MKYTRIDTEIGTFGLAWTASGVRSVALPGGGRVESWAADGAEPGEPKGALAPLPEMIRRYGQGERIDFDDVPLDLSGIAEFNLKAYAELLKIAYGETTTYGAIARTLGDLALARAVGTAMGQNRIPLIIPCHRVLGANGKPVGFSAPGGVTSKMRLLALEHAASPTGQYAFGF
jgi:methylated-DNA-[protein]-cysteine S-methyltransferase